MDKQTPAASGSMLETLEKQRAAFLQEGPPRLEVRLERLDRLIRLLLLHTDEIVETLALDFGGRSRIATLTGDILGGVEAIRYNQQHLAQWMQASRVELPGAVETGGAWAEVRAVPLGVVGAMVPWNGPVLMSILAAAGVLAAGNRLMLKPSEVAPHTAALLQRLFHTHFEPTEIAVINGDRSVAQDFSRLPFDHLIFTGSSAVGHQIMSAAADHLVPVTLELGGKNPVIVGRSADLQIAALRIVAGKLASAGQVCVAPDIVYLPRGSARSFCMAAVSAAQQFYPGLENNDDYTSLITDASAERLHGLLQEAIACGVEIHFSHRVSPLTVQVSRKPPLALVLNPPSQLRLMQEEIFAPLLAVCEYDTLEEVLADIRTREHPLSAYYFGHDSSEKERVLQEVQAGNMVVNDVRCQLYYEALPFGGVGASGMGRYRGHAGFLTFSNQKTVVHQCLDDAILATQRPPYAADTAQLIQARLAALRHDYRISTT